MSTSWSAGPLPLGPVGARCSPCGFDGIVTLSVPDLAACKRATNTDLPQLPLALNGSSIAGLTPLRRHDHFRAAARHGHSLPKVAAPRWPCRQGSSLLGCAFLRRSADRHLPHWSRTVAPCVRGRDPSCGRSPQGGRARALVERLAPSHRAGARSDQLGRVDQQRYLSTADLTAPRRVQKPIAMTYETRVATQLPRLGRSAAVSLALLGWQAADAQDSAPGIKQFSAPPSATASAASSGGKLCRQNVPRQNLLMAAALDFGFTKGEATVEFTLDAGEIKDMRAIRSTHPLFAEAALEIVRTWDCNTEAGRQQRALRLHVPFQFGAWPPTGG